MSTRLLPIKSCTAFKGIFPLPSLIYPIGLISFGIGLGSLLERLWGGELSVYMAIAFLLMGAILIRHHSLSPAKMQPSEISSVQRDIAAQKEAESRLRNSDARFHAFMDHSPTAAWITDERGKILYLNNTYFQLFKMPKGYVAGKSDVTLYPQEITRQYLDNIQRVIATNQAIETIEPGVRRDGTTGEYLVYKFPVPGLAGQSLVGGIAIDISDRQRIEDQLRLSEATKQAIISAIPDLLIRMKADGTYIDFVANNDFNVLKPDLIQEGLSVYDVLPPDLANLRVRTAQIALQTEKMQTYEQALTIHDQIFYEEVRIVPVEADQVLIMVRNVTDRKRAELALQQAKEAAEAASRAKSIFLANMSHELRTPLNVILGFTQLMERDPSLTPKHRETIQIMHRSGEHLLTLINDILDLSKIEAGHTTLNESHFNVLALLTSLQEMMHQRTSAKGLELHIEAAPDLPHYCTADVVKLRQVLINLLSNAIKFTHQGQIHLRVRSGSSRSHSIVFEVEDTGIGIGADEIETIFEAFTQSRSGKTTPGGTGLGLTITRHCVHLMGGEITVHSVPGQGSLFRVEIPVQSALENEVTQGEHLGERLTLAPHQPSYRILVVDDQPENRLLLTCLMQQLNMDVREACNGAEAIALWQEWHPHLIWMDIRMPLIDGYEATQTIRSRSSNPAPVIIALTAHASQSDRTLALKVGCHDFVTKPFQETELYHKMTEHLGLQFCSSEPLPLYPNGQSCSIQPTPSMQESLSGMPKEWLHALHHASQLCDEEEVKQLIQQIPGTASSLAHYLNGLAHHYQFHQIQQLILKVWSLD